MKPSFSEIMRRKVKRFKQNNLNLYRFLIAFLFFLGPLAGAGILFFGPLLGYLFVNSTSMLVTLGLSVLIVLLAIIVVQFYLLFWSHSELQFMSLQMGKKRAYFGHFLTIISQAAVFHIVVLAAFFRIDVNLVSILYVLYSYSLFIAVFTWRYRVKLEAWSLRFLADYFIRKNSRSRHRYNNQIGGMGLSLKYKLLIQLLQSGGWLRLALVVFTWLILGHLANSNSSLIFKSSFGAFIVVLNLFFVYLLWKLMKINVAQHALFWNLVSHRFYVNVQRRIGHFALIMSSANLWFVVAILF
jgi:hypothetical protein